MIDMLVLEQIISHLEKNKESTISEMMKFTTDLDRNRLSGFLRACEELEILESVGKLSHKKYRLKSGYLQRIEHLQLKVIRTSFSSSDKEKKWHFPHKTRLKERQVKWSDDIPPE